MDFIHFKLSKSPYSELDVNALRVATVYDKLKGGYTIVAELIYVDKFESDYDYKTAHGIKDYLKHEGRIQELTVSAKYRNSDAESKADEYTYKHSISFAEKLIQKINSALGTEIAFEKCSDCKSCKKKTDNRSCCSFENPVISESDDFGEL